MVFVDSRVCSPGLDLIFISDLSTTNVTRSLTEISAAVWCSFTELCSAVAEVEVILGCSKSFKVVTVAHLGDLYYDKSERAHS